MNENKPRVLSSSERKIRVVEQLGMPPGTAANRLRKLVLFNQLQKHRENICVRCDGTIETSDDLSIEHIKPWENRDSDLFWDLDNIAFSHRKCNVVHVNHGGGSRKVIAPEGQSWCFYCRTFKLVEQFTVHSMRWNGVSEECRDCKSKRNALRDRRKVSRFSDIGSPGACQASGEGSISLKPLQFLH